MRVFYFLLIIFSSETSLCQINNTDKSYDSIEIDYFYCGKVKRITYLDSAQLIHPKVLDYSRSGLIRREFKYDHGRYLLSYTYSVRGRNKGNLIKVRGQKIEAKTSAYMYEKDSSLVSTDKVNYRDSNGLRQGIWYIREISKNFSGFSFNEFYSTGTFKNGKKEGVWRYYNYHGRQLNRKVQYKNGIIDGEVFVYDLKGVNTAYYQYVNGEKSGLYRAYYDDGKIRVKAKFEKGTFIGEYFEYKKNGKIKRYIKDALMKPPY